jgi:hypothetical protein
MKRTCLGLSFAVFVLCLGIVSPNQAISKNANPGIVSPGATYGGMTYGQWSAHYYYEQAGKFIDPDAPDDIFDPKNVYFLQGKSVSDPTDHFDEYVPVGSAVMVMVLGSVSTTEGPLIPEWGYADSNWAEVDLDWLKSIVEQGGVTCIIDGVPVQNLKDYVVSGPLPHNLVMDDPTFGPITLDTVVSCSLILKPLTPGYHKVQIEWADWVAGVPFSLTSNIFVSRGRQETKKFRAFDWRHDRDGFFGRRYGRGRF